MRNDDTICALSTSMARPSARAIVRVSGPQTSTVLRQLGVGTLEHARVAMPTLSLPGSRLPPIRVTAYPFLAPRSFSGQDLVELHVPASPALVKLLLDALQRSGARLAEPGEFTARAYFNGKLNLAQAEGVAATIAASSRRELDAARQLLAGELATRLAPSMDLLADTLALVEVGIDFTDEDVTFLPQDRLATRLRTAIDDLLELRRNAPRLERLSLTPRVVLAGRPNAGKSTLINALAGQRRAVVSDVAGTTRDALSADVTLRRGTVTLVDVAGLDEIDEGDEIARQMRDAAWREIQRADVLVRVVEHGDDRPAIALPRAADLIVRTKADLTPSPGTPGEGGGEGRALREAIEDPHPNPLPEYRERGPERCIVSALTGVRLEDLRDALDRLAFGPDAGSTTASLALNARHVAHVQAAIESLTQALASVSNGDEVVAHLLRDALDQLGQVLGAVSPDDVLGRIFSRFCIGK
jgi:tRNA modification GTPase